MAKQIKVLYDHQAFLERNYGGVLRYFIFLYENMPKRAEFSTRIGALLSNNPLLSQMAIGTKFLPTLSFPKKRGLMRLIDEVYMTWLIRSGDYDLIHATYYNVNYIRKRKLPMVITVYDMIHERLRHKYPQLNDDKFMRAKRYALNHADMIISISDTTKKDVRIYYPEIDPEKIRVVHLCLMMDNTDVVDQEEKTSQQPYFLFIGTRAIYKNFNFLVEAFKMMDNQEINMICAGGGDFTTQEIALFNEKNISRQISYSPIDNDSSLASLYKNATAFIFPSEYEGFGLPILEAFHNGCPTLLADTEIFHEIAGESAMFFNLNDSGSLCSAMAEIFNSETLRAEMTSKGRDRLLFFSGEKLVDKTIACYKDLIQDNLNKS